MDPKRSLGQNFFTNKTLAEKIASIVTASNPELIIEIGPGTGAFTSLLETRCKKLVCIEKDDAIAKNLQIFFKGVQIVHTDVLDCDINKIVEDSKVPIEKVVMFGSLPYNISKPIIDKVLSTTKIQQQFYIIQKEVAQKYCAKAPDYNYLAVATQILATPKILLEIHPDSFRPRPKVTSSLIKFDLKSVEPIFQTLKEYKEFKDFVHLCFTKPNKTIKNNLGKDICNKISAEKAAFLERRPFALTKEELVDLFRSYR
jgi:16S rRNA (adenine1518-N6/adenine1519-N6)-dimethyltransferase